MSASTLRFVVYTSVGSTPATAPSGRRHCSKKARVAAETRPFRTSARCATNSLSSWRYTLRSSTTRKACDQKKSDSKQKPRAPYG